MIVNERQERPETDPLRKAGQDAERQMAFYLRRAFADRPDIHIFHDLRLEHAGEVAQIDHLALHRSGVVVIESKSVGGSVTVNEQGEWSRWYGRQGRGMPSPVLQARRQLDVLHSLLEANVETLLDRVLFGKLQKRTGNMSRHVLVAVSDGGRITRKCEVPELFKADQVPQQVAAIAEHYRKANGLLSVSRDGGYQFSDAELTRLVAFLKGFTAAQPASPTGAGRHGGAPAAPTPASPIPASPVPVPPVPVLPVPVSAGPRVSQEARAAGKTPAASAPVCRSCGGERLELKSGKYGPYFRCQGCEANTPARPVCAACGQPGQIQREGEVFSAECASGHRWPYFSRARAKAS